MIILSAGIFVVVLAGLGITRSGQVKEQGKLGTDLSAYQMRVNNMDTTQFQIQMEELTQQLEDTEQQLAEVKNKLRQQINSVDVTDKLYEIAAYYGVEVTVMGTSQIGSDNYQGVPCAVISLRATAAGELTDIIDFIAGMNNNFSTGFIQSVQIKVAAIETDELSEASINFIVYTYEGS
ncbi:MAG: hypothetical protein WC370_01180 [Dehalococcoidales bacterium]